MKRCLITGATGAVGPQVVKAFQAAGYIVRILVRREPRPDQVNPGVETSIGDLVDSPLSQATHDVDVVVHLAALLHVTARGRTLADYRRVNVEGTRRLIDAAISSNVSRIVYFSTIAVYGSGDGRVLDESSPPDPKTPYAASKLESERLVLNSRIGVVLRLASIYGAGIKGNYQSLVRAIKRGTYIPIGRGENRRTLIHEGDAARAAIVAAESNAVAGAVFNVTDGSFHSVREIVECIAAALGRKAPRFHLPVAPVRALASFVHASERLEKYLEDLAVAGTRFQRCTGFRPKVDLRSGWEATIRGMRDSGTH